MERCSGAIHFNADADVTKVSNLFFPPNILFFE